MISRSVIGKFLSDKKKRALKANLNKVRDSLTQRLFHYDSRKLKSALTKTGIVESDTLMVHVNYQPENGFAGTPADLANAFAELVGEKGNLLMVSLPFRGSAYDYLAKGKRFNVNRTLSMMGLVTEMFRRKDGTRRSLHPTHPVLAFGKDAEMLVAGHEKCLHPCGKGSPFEKFHKKNGKILFFDVSFRSITFFHYVEDLLKERLPFPVYDSHLFSVPAVDADGNNCIIQTFAFNSDIRRMAEKLEIEMMRQEKIKYGKVGNSRFCLVTAQDVVATFTTMVEEGDLPFDYVSGDNNRRRQDNE